MLNGARCNVNKYCSKSVLNGARCNVNKYCSKSVLNGARCNVNKYCSKSVLNGARCNVNKYCSKSVLNGARCNVNKYCSKSVLNGARCNVNKYCSKSVLNENKFFLSFPFCRDEVGHWTQCCMATFALFFYIALLWLFRSTFIIIPLPFSDLSSHNPPILAVVFLVFCILPVPLSQILSVISRLSF